MPKIVNHEVRRKELGEVTWRIIRRDGLEGVTVRNVAREAGISLGSLRYYFLTQNELLLFSMRLVSERVRERIEKLTLTGQPKKDILTIAAELLPIDEEKKTEAEVWLAFMGKAIVDPTFASFRDEMHDSLHTLFYHVLESLKKRDPSRYDWDVEMETRQLHALLDGIALHGVTRPGFFTPEVIMALVERYLNQLLTCHRG